jgi:hypothetical protein
MNGDTEKADMLAYDAMEYVREINDKTNVVGSSASIGLCILLYREDYDAVRKIALELYDSSMQENEKVNALNALELLCYVEWAQGNAVRFREYADECVALAAQANTPSGWFAYVHCSRCVDVLRTSLLTILRLLPLPMVREREAYIAKARAALGDAAFEKAWAEGAALSTEEAVRLALGEEA